MSTNWVQDIIDMHDHFGHTERFRSFTSEELSKLLEFRKMFLDEEHRETQEAKTADDFVDGCIDLCVVAIGSLHAFGVDAQEAWDRVHRANMLKETGIKESRPNPLGLPDLVKPTGWESPSHEDNTGRLSEVLHD